MHLSAHTALHSSLAHGHSNITIARGDGVSVLVPFDIRVDFRITPSELHLRTSDQPTQFLSDTVSLFTDALEDPGFRLALLGGPAPFAQQRFDATAVFPT